MKTSKKTNSALTTALITLFIIIVSATNSHASSQLEQISKIISHKLNVEKSGVGVAIVAIDGDKTEFLNFGLSKQANGEKVSAASLFEIGSISKTFTATALASMVKEGKIKLLDPVQNYLPEDIKLPSKNGKEITFQSLANHSSGLPRLPNNMPLGDPLDPYADYTIELMYQFLNSYQTPHEVAEKQEYSNLGAGLLGHVLALIDDKTYQAMITDRVLKPLNMTTTFIDIPQSHFNTLSDGHNEQLQPTKHWRLPVLAGAGALKSNTLDMAKYLKENMLMRRLPQEMALTQTSTSVFGNANTEIGLAWLINKTLENQYFMHNGGTGGFRSFMGFDAKAQKGIVILANSVFDLDEIGHAYLTNSLAQIKLSSPMQVNSEQLSKLNGEFELMPGFSLAITNKNEQLYVQATGQPKLTLTPRSATEFINQAVKARIVFDVNTQGEAQALTLYQGGQSLPGRKK